MTATVYSDYYFYLLERVGVTDREAMAYSRLFQELFSREFMWDISVDKDGNRAADGEKLREDFEDDTGGITDDYDNCSVLEMLVGLSIRCENEIMAIPDADNTRQWFWDMLCNLGLDKYDNKNWNSAAIDKILKKFMFRTYDYGGRGGLFPLRRPCTDQRNVEIWYQMASWLNENYDLTG